jgi:hypothetical protein
VTWVWKRHLPSGCGHPVQRTVLVLYWAPRDASYVGGRRGVCCGEYAYHVALHLPAVCSRRDLCNAMVRTPASWSCACTPMHPDKMPHHPNLTHPVICLTGKAVQPPPSSMPCSNAMQCNAVGLRITTRVSNSVLSTPLVTLLPDPTLLCAGRIASSR